MRTYDIDCITYRTTSNGVVIAAVPSYGPNGQEAPLRVFCGTEEAAQTLATKVVMAGTAAAVVGLYCAGNTDLANEQLA